MSNPPGRGILSRIDTNFTLNVYDDPWETNPQISPSKVFDTTSYTLPAVPVITKYPDIGESTDRRRKRNGIQKALSEVLIQLAKRDKPPSIVDTIRNTSRDSPERSIGALAETLKQAVKRQGGQKTKLDRTPHGISEDDSDQENDVIFSTDSTIELVLQWINSLTIAMELGCFLLDERASEHETAFEDDSRHTYSFRKSRNSFRNGGKRSRSGSPSRMQNQVPELLSSCLSILKSVVSEDCRYRVGSPRPSRPSNTLQILILNVAQILAYTHRHDPRVISEIAFAMIPAFYSFPRQMHPRLLHFFETSIVRIALQNLARLQGTVSEEPILVSAHDTFSPNSEDNEIPIVSIQIDEVVSQRSSRTPRKWDFAKSLVHEIQSTNNPHQSLHIYYLAFLIPSLIGAILDSVKSADEADLSASIPTQAAQLIRSISVLKIDTYNDLLEVIAYSGPKSRRWAIASLCEIWPKSVGHSIISSPFYPTPQLSNPNYNNDSYSHQFVPWYFDVHHSWSRGDNVLHCDCRSCLKPIHGFAIMCPSCMTAVHFDCYDHPKGNYHIQYTAATDMSVQRFAMLRFSDILQSGAAEPSAGHTFRPANWFTLCLCFVCQKPLWGCFAQGLKCERCPAVLHLDCLDLLSQTQRCGSIEITSKNVVIDINILRQSCLDHFPILNSTVEELASSSYEEISTYYCAQQIQLHILNNGITFGSVIVESKGKTSNNITITGDDFELHRSLDQCKQLLDSGRLPFSPLTQQYIQDSNQHRPAIMFNWSYLEYITAAIKTSFPQSRHGPVAISDFLDVEQPFESGDTTDIQDSASLPYESVTLVQIRNILRTDFTLRSDTAAKLILDQLYQLSFFDRTDNNPYPFESSILESDLRCTFPLPLGLDLSMNVETLVSSIEASLSDLDLTSNEFGFLLLTRRFWPNGLASEYGLKRLALRVFSWILDEDNSLAIILREYVAKQKNLPGVRTHEYAEPWPSSSTARSAPSGSANNGGDFVSARRSLLSRFALPWLLELHSFDPAFYCQIVFDACCNIVEDEDANFETTNSLNGQNKNKDSYMRCDDILRSIIKLAQCSVIFTVFDDLFLRWMDFVFSSGAGERAFSTLHRLFSNEVAQSTTPSSTMNTTDPILNSPDGFRSPSIDPLRAISNFANQSDAGLSRSIAYLPMLIKSGINIPIQTFKHLLPLLMAQKGGLLENANIFIRALALSLWIKSSRGQDLQDLVASVHSHLSSQISSSLKSGQNRDICLSIIRQSFCACLRVYGCDRASIVNAGLMTDSEIRDLPPQRKLTGSEAPDDPIFIHPKIMEALKQYIQSQVDDVTSYAAKFLEIFLTGSPYLESFEVDNFVLQNGKTIASCAWTTYNIQREDTATARTRLLLRSLLIDPEPLQGILSINMDPTKTSSKERLSSVIRLFRIILDVTSPDFQVEDRQWRSSVTEVFNWYFSPLWNDPSEEVRTAIKSSSSALLPAHFEIISQCWSESLLKAPIIERTRLISFLLQLRAHFTTWKVLSWDAMTETLFEYDYDFKDNTDHITSHDHIDSRKNANNNLLTADPEMAHLRVSIILLGLQMLADGIDIDSLSLMKLKVQLVQITGFNKVSVVPTQNGQIFRLEFGEIAKIEEAAYPCIEEIVHVIDAPYYLKVPQSALGITDIYEDEQANVLIGSVFLDAILTMLGTIRKPASLPVLTLKSLLEALYIIIHKYDFGIAPLDHLQTPLLKAILRTVEMISQDLSYELRQLSLSIAQVSISKCHTFLGAVNISIILEVVATEVASQTRHSQDALIVQGKFLIGNTLHMFHDKGLLLFLLRRPLQPSLFSVLHQVFKDQGKDSSSGAVSVCEYLLRDTLMRAMDCDPRYFSTMLENIASFVEIVYFQGYTSELLAYCGHRLGILASRMLDGSIEGLDSSPFISILSVLIQNNKKNIKGLLPHVETILRVALHRLVPNEACLTRLIKATSSAKPRANETSGSTDAVNVLFDILLDGFGMRTKMSPITMKALINSLLAAEKAMLLPLAVVQRQPFRIMIDDAYNFLQNYNSSEDNVDHNVECVMETAKLLLGAINRDPAHFQRLTEPATDKSSRVPPTMRSWNILLLVTLQESDSDWKTMIYDQFTSFCNTYSAVLRTYVTSGIASAATATTDINQAHISLKLWVMLAHSISMSTHNGELFVAGVWNELWPAYESFLDVLDTEARVGAYPALVSLASASVADLIVYMRSLKTYLSLDTSAYIAVLDRIRTLSLGDSSSHKIIRTLRLMSETPVQVSDTVLLDQIAKELVAAEKIRIMEGK